jgi:hypothetical protein
MRCELAGGVHAPLCAARLPCSWLLQARWALLAPSSLFHRCSPGRDLMVRAASYHSPMTQPVAKDERQAAASARARTLFLRSSRRPRPAAAAAWPGPGGGDASCRRCGSGELGSWFSGCFAGGASARTTSAAAAPPTASPLLPLLLSLAIAPLRRSQAPGPRASCVIRLLIVMGRCRSPCVAP